MVAGQMHKVCIRKSIVQPVHLSEGFWMPDIILRPFTNMLCQIRLFNWPKAGQ